jgi:hypothetical protein
MILMFYNVYLIFINGSNVFKMCVFYYISVEKWNMFINKAILKNALIKMQTSNLVVKRLESQII